MLVPTWPARAPRETNLSWSEAAGLHRPSGSRLHSSLHSSTPKCCDRPLTHHLLPRPPSAAKTGGSGHHRGGPRRLREVSVSMGTLTPAGLWESPTSEPLPPHSPPRTRPPRHCRALRPRHCLWTPRQATSQKPHTGKPGCVLQPSQASPRELRPGLAHTPPLTLTSSWGEAPDRVGGAAPPAGQPSPSPWPHS